jgi:hypothetical protein
LICEHLKPLSNMEHEIDTDSLADAVSGAVSDRERFMKAYLMTTGAVFGLITFAHVWRIIDEWPHLATDPWYILLTLATAVLSVWAWRLLRLSPRS